MDPPGPLPAARPRGAALREVDAVVHLAQSERYRDFPDGAEDVFAVNVQSTAGAAASTRAVPARALSSSPRPEALYAEPGARRPRTLR